MGKQGGGGWWRILLAARRVNESLTAAALAKKIGTSNRIASAWLAKMVRWGYARRSGTDTSVANRRWVRTYELTEYGKTREAPMQKRVLVPIEEGEMNIAPPAKKKRVAANKGGEKQ